MSDHDGHTINVGPVTVGEPMAKADPHLCSCRICAAARERTALVNENDRMRAENTALAAALADIADGECMNYDAVRCWELDPADPHEWCSACVAEVAWSAWKLGVLG